MATATTTQTTIPTTTRDDVAGRLRSWANQMFARFGHPVWLVGSALTEKYPRDVDVRINLPDAEFAGRYGALTQRERHFNEWGEKERRWARDMGKQSCFVARVCGVNIDFQVQSETEAAVRQFDMRDKFRIDQIGEI